MKILEESPKNKVPKTFFESIIGGVDGRFLPKKMQEMSGESKVKTLELIKESPYITIPELATALNKFKSTIEKQIAKLKENQKIGR